MPKRYFNTNRNKLMAKNPRKTSFMLAKPNFYQVKKTVTSPLAFKNQAFSALKISCKFLD